MNPTLYEQDYYLWLKETAELLRSHKLSELDIPNRVEEIEDMGKSEIRAIKSNLVIVLLHLLKYKYQPERREDWLASITEHRRRIQFARFG